MKMVRWGIIGCGEVTEVKSGPAFQIAEHSVLQAVMRRSGELAKDYAERHQVPEWFDKAEAIIHHPEIDAVYIATPPSSHMTYALMCAQAGKPVYVEKPMGMNSDECTEMLRACKDAGTALFVAYYRRALPKFIQIKEWVQEGRIGEVCFVKATHYAPPSEEEKAGKAVSWRVDPALSGGGKFVDVASHTLDIFDFILGPISKAQGVAANQGGLYAADDIVSAQFTFESGVHGTGVWCFASFDYYEMNEIVGSQGRILFSTFGNEPVVLQTESEKIEVQFEMPKHIQQPLIQSVVDELIGKGLSPSTGESAMRTNRVMDAIYGSSSILHD
ncbi:oxidoreductase [Paenibacillus sp. FSL H8-0548]|uniref:Gfo/Idh/MocA family protein n=1 Tax=Paenibacillus sp. FSL H8-0548 TaxID=1920422 RepID=UPI00096F59D4|nr:Gfo/Idh/MocA family oxidoreductase [Paenibacillus sp. FSL H8-0548]OMF23238.1 oxidoreductase [Paenibacillus sp. FSL H8-0548]